MKARWRVWAGAAVVMALEEFADLRGGMEFGIISPETVKTIEDQLGLYPFFERRISRNP